MKKAENVFIALQLVRDQTSGALTLSVQFDPSAPNVSTEKNSISWCPTREELEFISEAFTMFASGTPQQPSPQESTGRDSPHYTDHETTDNGLLDRVLEKKKITY